MKDYLQLIHKLYSENSNRGMTVNEDNGDNREYREIFEQAQKALADKDLDLARTLFTRCTEMKPDDAEALNKLGVVHAHIGAYDEAHFMFSKVITMAPGFAPAYSNMGNLHFQRGEWAKAEEYYRKAIEVDPEYTVAYNNLAAVCKKTGKIDQSVRYIKKAYQLGYRPPFDPQDSERLGCLAWLTGIVRKRK